MYSGGGAATMWSPEDDKRTQEQKDIERLSWEVGSLRGEVHRLETENKELERKLGMVHDMAIRTQIEMQELKKGNFPTPIDNRDGLDKIADWLYSGGKNE